MKKIVRYVIIHYLLTMFNTNKQVKDDIFVGHDLHCLLIILKGILKGDGTIIENPVESP